MLDRRRFLQGAVVAGGAVAVGPFGGFVSSAGAADRGTGYGVLRPVADKADGVVRLELPAGFNYRSFHHAG